MSTNFMIGAHFEGRYRIDAEIGAGGVGAVYRAVHIKLGRAVALKVLQEKYGASNELRHRFEREAKALAALSHPNIVTVTDYGIAGGVPYLVMELLEGKTLDQRIHGDDEGELEMSDALDIARQILKALSFVHEQGLVHRDMKPGNIFLQAVPGSKPHVKLLDFGLAKFLAAEGQQDTGLTRAGQVFGTPSYMAPEQVAGQETDARTDVYAVGVILFEMLSGRKPFEGNAPEIMRKHLVEPLPSLHDVAPHRKKIAELDELLRRATAKLQKDRFQNALALARALDDLPSSEPAGSAPQRGRPEAPTVAAFSAAATKNDSVGHPPPAPRPSLLPRGASPVRTALYAALPLAAILGLSALMHSLQQQNHAASPKPAAEKTETKAVTNPALGAPPKEPGGLRPSAGTTPASTAIEKPIEPGPPLPSADPASNVIEPPPPGGPLPPPPDSGRVWKNAPKLLVGTRDAVRAGTPLSRRTLNYLHEYNSKNPGDPRGHLLLARAYMNRGWRKDALNEYAVAFKLNPDVRGEPKMLTDLVDLVAHGSTMAGDLIRSAYGTHALSEIERAMDDVAPNREMVGRLEELRDGLRG